MSNRRILVVRHAQSAANAGHRTSDPASIPITELGRTQAEQLAEAIAITPSRIITSSFVRTHQTAAPLTLKHPQATREQWEIHEFTYLSPPRFAHSSPDERRPFVDAFWRESDPFRIDGPGAESVAQFVGRVREALTALASGSLVNEVVVTHGQVMQTMLYLVAGHPTPADRDQVRRYREITLSTPIANTAILPLEIDAEIRAGAISTSHLSSDLITY
jgi:broad specificity phosphatase PhoE